MDPLFVVENIESFNVARELQKEKVFFLNCFTQECFLDFDGKNGESNLQVDEFFKYEICSIKKKKLYPFFSNIKVYGNPTLDLFVLCF